MQQPTLEADSVTIDGTITIQDGGNSITTDARSTSTSFTVTSAGTPTSINCAGYSTVGIVIANMDGEAICFGGLNTTVNATLMPHVSTGSLTGWQPQSETLVSDGTYFFNIAGFSTFNFFPTVHNSGSWDVLVYLSAAPAPFNGTQAYQGGGWTVTLNPQSETLSPLSGTASSSGNNLILSPSNASRKIRVYYASYNPTTDSVTAAFRFGAAGTMWLKNNVNAKSVVAKDFGATRYIEGAANESLYLNLDAATDVIYNVMFSQLTA